MRRVVAWLVLSPLLLALSPFFLLVGLGWLLAWAEEKVGDDIKRWFK